MTKNTVPPVLRPVQPAYSPPSIRNALPISKNTCNSSLTSSSLPSTPCRHRLLASGRSAAVLLATPPTTPPDSALCIDLSAPWKPSTNAPLAGAASALATLATTPKVRRGLPQPSPPVTPASRRHASLSASDSSSEEACEEPSSGPETNFGLSQLPCGATQAYSPPCTLSNASSLGIPPPAATSRKDEDLQAQVDALKTFISLHDLDEVLLTSKASERSAIVNHSRQKAPSTITRSAPEDLGVRESSPCASLLLQPAQPINDTQKGPVAPPASVDRPLGRSPLTIAIGRETDLAQSNFYKLDNAASWAPIREKIKHAILSKGHRLTQKCVWFASGQNFPGIRNKFWPGGPHEVKLGFLDLCEQELGQSFPEMRNGDINSNLAHSAMIATRDLRNAVCHPGKRLYPQQTKKIDSLLQLGHDLAVHFQQYDIAMEFRDLRRVLREYGEQAWKEMSAKLVNQTPAAKFEPHEEQMFFNMAEYPEKDAPASLKIAAEIWRKGGHPLSRGYPGEITRGDGYVRRPGQDDQYFRTKNEPQWLSGSEQHKKILQENGVPSHLANASPETLEDDNLKAMEPFVMPWPDEVDTSFTPGTEAPEDSPW